MRSTISQSILPLSQEVPPVMPRNLARAIRPRLQVLALRLGDVVELIGVRAEDIR